MTIPATLDPGPDGATAAAEPVDLAAPMQVGDVEIGARVALAPMAGVSVQAFRRQGRRFGAGLVCTEMVSSAGLHHGNERTKGFMRIAPDEHPVALQVFGSVPEHMAEAASMVAASGADIIDINMGCPVRKVTKTQSGCALMSDSDRAVAVARAVVDGAGGRPVTVKIRRGYRNGSMDFLELGRRLVAEAGVAGLTLHPRSAEQMYTGRADHELTRQLVEAVDVPVWASGDITTRAEAIAVMQSTGAAGVMVGRAAQGNPWVLHEMVRAEDVEPEPLEKILELIRFMREVVHEMGEQRATGFLKKFYGWYLKGNGFTRAMRNEVVQAGSPGEVERHLIQLFPKLEAAIDARAAAWRADLPDHSLDAEVALPVSIYAGG